MGKINMVEAKSAENPDEIRYIVRIVGKDLNGLSPVWHALLGIKGIGQRMAVMMARVFESKTGIEYDAKLGEIPDDKHKVLEDIVMHPGNYGIPSWAFNRGKDIESGKDTHLVMSELDFSLRNDLQRLREIKTYRGMRHTWGLPVRGGKTRTRARKRGVSVGVEKKAAKAAMAPKAGEKAGGKEEKKK